MELNEALFCLRGQIEEIDELLVNLYRKREALFAVLNKLSNEEEEDSSE